VGDPRIRGLGLGCWLYGGIAGASLDGAAEARGEEEAARAIIRRAGELGIRHLDTAADYGDGRSERIVGSEASRSPGLFAVATKMRLLPSAREAEEAVAAALSRLDARAIDLFYIHWPSRGMDPRPMMEGLEACRARGELGFLGVSNFSVRDMELASEAGRIDYHQCCWSLAWRRPEAEVAPWCRERGIGIVAYSPLAQGLLADAEKGPSTRLSGDPRNRTVFYKEGVRQRLAPIVRRMRSLAAGAGLGLGELALRWVLSRPGLASAVAGASSVAQLEANAAAAAAGAIGSGPREAGLLEALEALSDEIDAVLPREAGNIFEYYP
jgi:myo-inositol catabolism protein IolS